jgi:signal transduction histidine kinase
MIYFQPWDWIISASAYVEEFDKMINLSDFKQKLNSLKLRETGYFYILDYKGNVITHPEYEGKNVFHLKDGDGKNFIQKICTEKSGHFIYSWKGLSNNDFKDKFVIFEDIPELGWIIASAGYVEEYFKPLEVIQWIFIVAVILVILIIIPINFKITNSLIKPLNDFIDKLKNANKDDYSIRLESENTDEVGELANCFNGYMEKLEKYQLELKEANTKLEQRVDTLQTMLPICANCKKIRDDSGYWNKLELYLKEHSDVNFSSSICPTCMIDLYPEYCDDGSPDPEHKDPNH